MSDPNRHQQRIDDIVETTRETWLAGFIPSEPDWTKYEKELRKELNSCSASEITHYRAAFI